MSSRRLITAAVAAALLGAVSPAGAMIIDIVKIEPDDAYASFGSSNYWEEDGVLGVDITKNYLENPYGLLPMVIEFQITMEADDVLTRVDIMEDIANSTGIPWTDFEIFLINMPGDHFAGAFFNNSAPPTGNKLDFIPGSSGDNLLTFEGGPVPSESTVTFADIWIEFTEELTPGNTYTFRLKQQPTPEPASLALLGAGLVALGRRTRRLF